MSRFHYYRVPNAIVATAFASLVACGGSSSSNSTEDADQQAGSDASAVEQLALINNESLPSTEQFANTLITEASGLQRSMSTPGVYYVHNDSGDNAVVYVTDAAGQSIGTIALNNVTANDWEAIAGARLDGIEHLIVGDIGNNNQQRNPVQLYVVKEPDINSLVAGFTITADSQRIDVSYADGLSYNAESLFIDGDNDSVVIVTKNGQDTAAQGVWKGSLSSGLADGTMVLEYRGLVTLAAENLVNAVTDIDIHPNGREIAVLTYGPLSAGTVHIWAAREGEGTADALTRDADQQIAVSFNMNNTQAEGVSYSANGAHLLIAAEGPSTSTLTLIAR